MSLEPPVSSGIYFGFPLVELNSDRSALRFFCVLKDPIKRVLTSEHNQSEHMLQNEYQSSVESF